MNQQLDRVDWMVTKVHTAISSFSATEHNHTTIKLQTLVLARVCSNVISHIHSQNQAQAMSTIATVDILLTLLLAVTSIQAPPTDTVA